MESVRSWQPILFLGELEGFTFVWVKFHLPLLLPFSKLIILLEVLLVFGGAHRECCLQTDAQWKLGSRVGR